MEVVDLLLPPLSLGQKDLVVKTTSYLILSPSPSYFSFTITSDHSETTVPPDGRTSDKRETFLIVSLQSVQCLCRRGVNCPGPLKGQYPLGPRGYQGTTLDTITNTVGTRGRGGTPGVLRGKVEGYKETNP